MKQTAFLRNKVKTWHTQQTPKTLCEKFSARELVRGPAWLFQSAFIWLAFSLTKPQRQVHISTETHTTHTHTHTWTHSEKWELLPTGCLWTFSAGVYSANKTTTQDNKKKRQRKCQSRMKATEEEMRERGNYSGCFRTAPTCWGRRKLTEGNWGGGGGLNSAE